MAGRKGSKLGALKSVPVIYPQNDQDKAFCEAYKRHGSVQNAWREAGFKSTNSTAMERKYRQFSAYLQPYMEKKANMAAEKLAVDQEGILAKMAAIGFADPSSFVVVEDVLDGKGEIIGTRERLKYIRELTPLQASAISLVEKTNGDVTYTPPNAALRHRAQHDLGLHLGMFHPKLIHEHRHMHLHAAVTLKGVSTESLAQAEQALIAALGPQVANRMLGITTAELEYAKSVDTKK